jgi:hypothetical protein
MGLLGIFSNIFQFGKKDHIEYESGLIRKFKKDHQKLLDIYGDMLEYHKEKKFPELKKSMKNFRVTVNLHILEEDEKLYSYLVQESKGDQDKIKMHKEVHDEMKEIVKVVSNFFDKYENNLLGSKEDKFEEELQGIGSVLVDRIEREENGLYTLYK